MGATAIQELRGRGEQRFFGSTGNNYISHRAAAVLTGDYDISWPDGAPAGARFLQMDAAGDISYVIGASGTLDNAYDSGGAGLGRTINAGNGAVEIIVAAASGNACLFLNQDDNQPALDIDSEATGQPLLLLQPLLANTRGDIAFGTVRTADPGAPSEGDCWYNSTDNALKIHDGVGVVDLTDTGLNTQNTLDEAYDEGGAGAGRTITASDGAVQITGSANVLLDLDQGGNFGGLTIDKTDIGNANVVSLVNAGEGATLYIDHNYAGANENYALLIESAQTGAANRAAVRIDTTGDNTALFVNGTGSTGNNSLVDIVQANGGHHTVEIESDTTANVLNINHTGSNLGPALIINAGTVSGVPEVLRLNYNNSGGAAANGVLFVDNTDTGATVGILINSAGTANYIDTDAGAGTPAHLSNAGVWTDASCFRRLKRDIELVDVGAVLDGIKRLPIARYFDKADRSEEPRRRFGTFQDELVEFFGLDSRGVSATELAVLALAGVKALAQRA